MTEGETFYVTKLVRNILSRGYSITVDDGEEITLELSRREGEILDALGTTDEDRIYVDGMDGGRPLGWFFLVYGNDPSGEEVVCDYTANALCDSICRDVFGWPEEQAEFPL